MATYVIGLRGAEIGREDKGMGPKKKKQKLGGSLVWLSLSSPNQSPYKGDNNFENAIGRFRVAASGGRFILGACLL